MSIQVLFFNIAYLVNQIFYRIAGHKPNYFAQHAGLRTLYTAPLTSLDNPCLVKKGKC